MIFATIGLVGFSAYDIGRQQSDDEQKSQEQQQQLLISRSLEKKLTQHEKELAVAVRDAQGNLNALAKRIGSIQAKTTRLEAVGERLLEEMGLSTEEFDFSNVPALGGLEDPAKQLDFDVPNFIQTLEELSVKLNEHEEEYKLFDSIILQNKLETAARPSGKPVKKGWVSSGYGKRADPFTGKQDFHRGLDFSGKKGYDVVAVATGVITWAGKQKDYGNVVEIDHGFGYVTRYAHNDENLVKVGDKVEKDQLIALMGSTGRSTGAHVHFEIEKDGKRVDPKNFLK